MSPRLTMRSGQALPDEMRCDTLFGQLAELVGVPVPLVRGEL
jgi:hypothetical protein